MSVEKTKSPAEQVSEETKESQPDRFIDKVIKDIESGQWRSMSETYVQTGQGSLPYLYEIDQESKAPIRGITLGFDEKNGKVLDKVVKIEEWLKWGYYENGSPKEIYSICYDGNGKKVLEHHKKYNENGELLDQ